MLSSQSRHIYRIGDIALPCDVDTSNAADAKANRASHHLKPGDGAFVRRSDRLWHYAIVHEVRSRHIIFKVKEDGSTKKVGRSRLADGVLPHLTKTSAQARRDRTAGKKVGISSSWRSGDETTPECESHGSSSSKQKESAQVDSLDICGPAAETKKRYTNFAGRRRFSLRRAASNAAGVQHLSKEGVLSNKGSGKVVVGTRPPRARARRRGSVVNMASNVARRLSSFGKKNRQGNVAARDDSDTAPAIEEVKKWDEQEEKGSVAPKQPPIQASKRRGLGRRGSVTKRMSQALRLMMHEMSRDKSSRRPAKHESKLTVKGTTTSEIFNSLMAGELKQPSLGSRRKVRWATEQGAAEMPYSAASVTKQSCRGHRAHVESGESCIREFFS